jgi:phage shock protein PspC (stress-responsive transcriptional regulator)
MKKVVSISLNGIAFQLEENGYDELRVYLERAEARLQDSPDRSEIMADLEQAIGEKCSRVLGPHKTVVSGAEISSILTEMGPVESADEKPADASFGASAGAIPPGTGAAPPLRKRLFKIREGEMWFGVCNGIAAYLGVDVTWVRIAVVVLALVTTGFALLAYFALVIIVPYAETSEDRAAAFGAPFSTEEFIGRAKKKSEDGAREYERWRREWRRQQLHWQRQWNHMNAQMRQATANAAPQMSNAARAISAVFVPIAAVIGAVLFVGFILALIELIAQHSIFGWHFSHAIPLWVLIVSLAAIYAIAATVVRAIRYGGSPAGAQHAGWSALHTVIWICTALLLLWVAYTFIPGIGDVVDQLVWAANLTIDNLSETIVSNHFSLIDVI